MFTFNFNENHYHSSDPNLINLLNELKMSFEELLGKFDTLTATIVAEKEQVADALAELRGSISDLQEMIANGATPEQLLELSNRLDGVAIDIAAILPDQPPVEPV